MNAWLVGCICLLSLALFLRNRIAPDVVAVIALGCLALLGLVTPKEAVSGFSSPATIAVGAMFVLSAGLRETGALDAVARFLARIGRNAPSLQLALTVKVAAISAFINNTAAVAVFLPMVLGIARRRQLPASKLLIPLSYASQFGGACTLIGTSTNLLVNSLAISAGLGGFALFDFAPVGILLVAVGCTYLITIGWWLLPRRAVAHTPADAYALRAYVFAVAVGAQSRWAGKAVGKTGLGRGGDVVLLELVRDGRRLWPREHDVLLPGDRLILQGDAEQLFDLARRNDLQLDADPAAATVLEGDGLQLIEVVVAPMARAVDCSLGMLDRSWSPGAMPVAIARRDTVLRAGLSAVPLRAGDALLLLVSANDVPALRDDADFVVLSERDNPTTRRRRAPLAIAIVAAVVLVAAMGWLRIEIAALLGAAAMAVGRCIGTDRIYRNVELRVLVLLAAMLPLGIAIEKTGAADALVKGAFALLPMDQPIVALAVVYGLTMLMTELITNNATAVLMTPIALALAEQLGVQAAPFLVAVALAASTSFSTPIGYQTNTMVYAAGGYTFKDFLKVGVPLNLLFWGVSVWAIPRWFPF
jgi:di/tricarboxylate transporter